jgi:hypothetical protein
MPGDYERRIDDLERRFDTHEARQDEKWKQVEKFMASTLEAIHDNTKAVSDLKTTIAMGQGGLKFIGIIGGVIAIFLGLIAIFKQTVN